MKRSAAAETGVLILLTSLGFTAPVFAQSSSATFSGEGFTHVVAEVVSTGQMLNLVVPTTFTVQVTPGGPSVGTLALTVTLMGTITMSADGGAHDPVETGQITVTPTSATGGGTLNNPATGRMSQFGFGVTSENGRVAGQFQCQNTGRSANIVDGALSALLGKQVDVLQMTVHGTATTFTAS